MPSCMIVCKMQAADLNHQAAPLVHRRLPTGGTLDGEVGVLGQGMHANGTTR